MPAPGLNVLCFVSALCVCVCLASAQLSSSERIKVLFTPTVCRLRCSSGRCTNVCERGNVTTVYNSQQPGHTPPTAGFRAFLCPMLCKNGGVCIQKDQCLCPPNFTGKFCHIPVSTTSTNEIEKLDSRDANPANEPMTSEYILPLQTPEQISANASRMVKVRVQHPPEASVKIHQVLKVNYSPTVQEHSETVTWSMGLSAARSPSLPKGGAEVSPPRVQAQTIRGDSVYTESSGFKYCFREVRNGQCSSPLPGLRSLDMCCRGAGKAWGLSECTLCPPSSGNSVNGAASCPKGFHRLNGTQCVDINECLQPGFCENGNCVNTRGSYSCVCREGFILDASHGICISHKVISEEKDQCFRVLNQGSCSLPILRNITKQICCCSRVGKAWGKSCQPCPFFGSTAFKEICPAGPGYHYSASAIQFNQRASGVLDSNGPPLVSGNSHSSSQESVSQPESSRTVSHSTNTQTIRVQQPSFSQATSQIVITQPKPNQGSTDTRSNQGATDVVRTQTSRPSINRPPVFTVRPAAQPVTPQPPNRQDTRVCESRPQICGAGRCINLPGARHTCLCNTGFIYNPLQGHCQDINECLLTPRPCSVGQCENTPGSFRCVCPSGYQTNSQQTMCIDLDECRQVPNPCVNGRCENTMGSFRCVCRAGYKLHGTNCIDIDECDDPLRCPGKECVNSPGSFRCVSCKPGFDLLNGQCSDIDECRRLPCRDGRCENTPGSFRCSCRTGYRLQGNTCLDVNECEDATQCPGQQCVNSLGSYRCVSCRPGFAFKNGACSDVDECHQKPDLCQNGVCENTPGSFRCACRNGYRLQGGTCADVNECEDSAQCPGQECVNSQGSYRCVSCRPGFILKNRVCADIDECRQTPDVCFGNRCENTVGSYKCVCQPGFRLEGSTCKDVNECENELQCPGKECVNSIGSFKCVSCQTGYELLDGQCQDIDECFRIPRRCTNGECKNTPGSYKCICDLGFNFQDGVCTDMDECLDPLQCPGQQCINSPGSYKCVPCKEGHSLQNGRCSDVDECSSPKVCGSQSVCVNTDGSFRCECAVGFRASGPGRQCRDINECVEGDLCFSRGECVNTEGSYNCVCAPGYVRNSNGTSCHDLDECAADGVCHDGRCTNTEGSFLCHCQNGFTSNPEKTACLDVNECLDSEAQICGSQRCENTIGSFRCVSSCEPGYTFTDTGECVDINECVNETVCGAHAFCRNLIGTFQCLCDQGYETTASGACEDINECETMQGVCGSARCWNVEGSFTCECENRNEEFDPLASKCVTRERTGGSGSSSSSSSSSATLSSLDFVPQSRPEEQRECYYGISEPQSCKILAANTTRQECCCTAGQAWGNMCRFDSCPTVGTAEFQSLCPSGRGYITTEMGPFRHKDVDECKLFDPEVCKGGVCVNNIPGYACYCSSGFYYDTELLECIDNDECEAEEACGTGRCVNTMGTFYCTCEPPLVLDDTQRNCVNASILAVDESLNFCWRHVTAGLVCQSPMLGTQLSFTECCCQYGEAWGMQCALCPRRDEEAYEALCNEFGPPPYSPRYFERFSPGPSPGRGGGYLPPYGPPEYSEPLPGRPEYIPTDYDDYSLPGAGTGGRSGLRGRPDSSYGYPEEPYRPIGGGGYYEEDDYDSAPGPPFGLPDPRSERTFDERPLPPRADGRPLSLAPLPENSPYSEAEGREPWRAPPPFPIFPDRGEGPRRLYERRYEPYGSLSSQECGIIRGCENGRCIRVEEGYTCDCYDGFQLDITTMTCIDLDECEDEETHDCINAHCVNTEGSYRCVCLRGFTRSRVPNHCIAA